MSQPYQTGDANKAVVDALQKVLADTFVLYAKTHSFHWNVEGPHFQSLHELFGEQYTEMWNAMDDIAERIRALGAYAPNTYSEMIKNASIGETSQTPDANSMLEILANDNTAVVDTIYTAIKAGQEAEDEGTTDMMIARSQEHEKYAWMLRSHLKG